MGRTPLNCWSYLVLWDPEPVGGFAAGTDPGDCWMSGGCHQVNDCSLTSVKQKLKQATAELGQEVMVDMVMVIEELDVTASISLGTILWLVTSSYKNTLRKEG